MRIPDVYPCIVDAGLRTMTACTSCAPAVVTQPLDPNKQDFTEHCTTPPCWYIHRTYSHFHRAYETGYKPVSPILLRLAGLIAVIPKDLASDHEHASGVHPEGVAGVGGARRVCVLLLLI